MSFDLASQIMPTLVTGSVALFAYLVKFYFSKIQEAIENQSKESAKLDGKLEILSKDIRDGIAESAAMRAEIKALWRFVDNANQRASDRRAS